MNGKTRKTIVLMIGLMVLVTIVILPKLAVLANTQLWFVWLPVAMNNYPLVEPTPTATLPPVEPTATPTQPPVEGVQVLPNHSTYLVTYFDYVDRIVVGEVQNNLGSNIEFVRVTVKFYDSNGTLIDYDWTYTFLDTLHAGEKTCFRIWLDEPENWAYYEFSPVEYRTTATIRPKITLLSHNGGIEPMFGWYEIIGEVRNDHDALVRFVMPVFTLYNSGGTVLDCDFTFTDTIDLEPGQTSPFENYFTLRDDYTEVADYRIQIDGMP